jgi:hypothetical protein
MPFSGVKSGHERCPRRPVHPNVAACIGRTITIIHCARIAYRRGAVLRPGMILGDLASLGVGRSTGANVTIICWSEAGRVLAERTSTALFLI